MHKDTKQLTRILTATGWTVKPTPRGWAATHPDTSTVITWRVKPDIQRLTRVAAKALGTPQDRTPNKPTPKPDLFDAAKAANNHRAHTIYKANVRAAVESRLRELDQMKALMR